MPPLAPVTMAVALAHAPPLPARHQARARAAGCRSPADLQRRGDDHRAGRRQQVEVGEALQAVAAGAVHVVVAGIGRAEMQGLAGIGADGLGAEAEHVALLDQEPHRLGARARRVLAGLVAVRVVADRCAWTSRCASAPSCAAGCGRAALPMPSRRPRSAGSRDWRPPAAEHVDHAAGAMKFAAGMVSVALLAGPCPRSSGPARRNACRCARRSEMLFQYQAGPRSS